MRGFVGMTQTPTGKLLDLYEKELFECDTKDNGCVGGLMNTALVLKLRWTLQWKMWKKCKSWGTLLLLGMKYDTVEDGTWGADWGEGGYMRMPRGIGAEEGLCGVAMYALHP